MFFLSMPGDSLIDIRVVECFCLVVCLVVRLMFFLLMTFDVFLRVLPDSLGCSSTGCCSFRACRLGTQIQKD